jgi:hypothetical protein
MARAPLHFSTAPDDLNSVREPKRPRNTGAAADTGIRKWHYCRRLQNASHFKQQLGPNGRPPIPLLYGSRWRNHRELANHFLTKPAGLGGLPAPLLRLTVDALLMGEDTGSVPYSRGNAVR